MRRECNMHNGIETPTGLELACDEVPVIGDRLEIAPGVFWIRMPLPFSLNHINLWILKDGDGWTLVDTGFPTAETKAAWEMLLKDIKPVKRIIVTHFHPDHTGLAGWLAKKTGAPVHMAPAEFAAAKQAYTGTSEKIFDAYRKYYHSIGVRHDIAEQIIDCHKTYRNAGIALTETVTPIYDDQSFTIDGHKWHVVMGYGHSPAHVCLFAPELNVFIPGDLILPWISTNIGAVSLETADGDPLGDYMNSLARFEGLLSEDCLILPSHGEPFYGAHHRIKALTDHHARRLNEVAEICRVTAQTPFQIMQRLFRRPLEPLDMFFALGETIAHTNALMADGRLTKLEDKGQIRFALSTVGAFHSLLGTK